MPEVIQAGAITINFLLTRDDTDGAFTMFEAIVPPQAGVGVPHHHSGWEETVYGIEGVTTLTVGDNRVDLKAGDAFVIPRGVVHALKNETDRPAKSLAIVTPGVLGPEFFREIAMIAVPGTPPDLGKMAEVMTRHGLVPVPVPNG
jgi:quercetin dioxygenase-like cupin family protein